MFLIKRNEQNNRFQTWSDERRVNCAWIVKQGRTAMRPGSVKGLQAVQTVGDFTD